MEFRLKRYRISEANIQAECYHKLKLLGIRTYLEYGCENCRFDMVVLNGSKIIAIVEFKNGRAGKPINQNTRQYKKYHSFGLPVIYCKSVTEIEETIKKIQALF